ncbi:uncharacterized protein LOC126777630 isoform X2 [Nymphalis io]|uniref:uncharacterized protein LOC126777630 isoform X2 n=1 Tax=Inachis io TaxID=171585 RepID=UPI00216746A8|nr:uncharacterized protein LOC126777630 isoform X2 [Nymphalis io]
MENEEKLSLSVLEDRPYRYLQQMAKSIGLPSNFKMAEVTSTSRSCFSPPITITPKRSNQMYVRCSPEQRRHLVGYNPKRNLIQNLNQNPTPNSTNSSGRILRSFNMKTLKPNYALMNGHDIFKSHTNPKETKIKIITNNSGFPQFNVTAKCVVKKHRPSVLANGKTAFKTHLMLAQSMDLLQNPIPAKRQRSISGIYPLIPSDTIPRNLHTTERVCLRKIDGSLTKINALVQRRNIDVMPRQKNNYKNTEVNIQDILNSIDANTEHVTYDNRNSDHMATQYPNLSSIDTAYSNMYNSQLPIESNIKDNDIDTYSVYYHKKIRAEQIRCQRLREMQDSERLPKIGDVFSKFSDVYRRDLMQPLYVQVSTEAERSQNHPLYVNRGPENSLMLEQIYNFKSQQLNNAPLLQIATTSNTKCVYSTPVVATAVAQPSTIVSNEAYVTSFEVDSHRNQHDVDPRLYEFIHFSEQTAMRKNYSNCDDFSTSTSSQDISTTVSIPEMVEDALEIISQDGDYMEQIAMDVRVECVLCVWAGPKILLEYHIKREHAQQIHRQRGSEWAVPWAVPAGPAGPGAPGGPGTTRHVLQLDDALYVLSARYCDPDCFRASLASLSTEGTQKFGSITIYNKVSGEPFSWSGHIQPLSPNLPYENEASCLKIELSKLDLLPNSANLKLFNRELVTDSPSKVIIGQPLNDIQLMIFVRIFN